MFKRFGVLVSAANIATILALACGGAAAPTATKAPAAGAAAATATRAPAAAAATATAVPAAAPTVAVTAKATGKVTIAEAASTGVVSDLDPGSWRGGQRGLYRVIFEPLMYMDPDGTNPYTPMLATSWEMAKDGLSWTFHLRKGVKFHNGEDFDAQVMAKNMKRARGLQGPFFQENTAGYEFPDTHTLVLRLKKPDLGLLSRLVYGSRIGYPAPSKLIDEAGEAVITSDLGAANSLLIRRNPVGTGPYKQVKFDPHAPEHVLEAFEGWNAGWGGYRPTVKTVRQIGIPEQTVRIAAMAAGEVDIIYLTPGPTLKELRGGRAVLTPSVRVWWGELYQHRVPNSPYNNVKVRQAMNYAIDKEAMIDKLLGGAGTPAVTVISPMQFGYPKDVKPYPYDPQKARQLLAEAGFPNGLDVGEAFAGNDEARTWSLAIASYFADVGMKIQVGSSLGHATRNLPPVHDLWKEMGFGFTGSSLGGDGDYRVENFETKWQQHGYVVDTVQDDLYDKTLGTVDNSERERILQQMATRSNQLANHLFLWYVKAAYGWGPRIADWKLTPGEELGPDGFQTIRLK